MVRLEVIAGNAIGTSIHVEDELVIGRLAEGPGRLADDDEISRSHARVAVDAGGTCAIEDLGSTNGTFVNGMRISAPRVLAEGDTIEVGGTSLIVRELPQPAPPRLQPTVVPGTPVPRPEAPESPSEASVPPPEASVPPPGAPVPPPGAPVPPPGAPVPPPEASVPPPEASVPPPGAPVPPPEAPVLPPEAQEPPGEEPPTQPQPPPFAEPVAESAAEPPEPTAEPAPPPLSLQLTVDFAAREARIALDDQSEPVRLIFEGGVWRPAPIPPSQEG